MAVGDNYKCVTLTCINERNHVITLYIPYSYMYILSSLPLMCWALHSVIAAKVFNYWTTVIVTTLVEIYHFLEATVLIINACIWLHVSRYMYLTTRVSVHVFDYTYLGTCIWLHVSYYAYLITCVSVHLFDYTCICTFIWLHESCYMYLITYMCLVTLIWLQVFSTCIWLHAFCYMYLTTWVLLHVRSHFVCVSHYMYFTACILLYVFHCMFLITCTYFNVWYFYFTSNDFNAVVYLLSVPDQSQFMMYTLCTMRDLYTPILQSIITCNYHFI